jgi:hypothetical protein
MTRNHLFLNDQSGAALVIALLMMIVLTLIGLASTFTSTFEIKLSGNKRGSTNAFYSADSGTQVVVSDYNNFTLPGKYDIANTYHYSLDTANPNPTKADIIILHDTTRTDCRGLGYGSEFDCLRYTIDSKGQDQVDLNPIKSTTTVQQRIVYPVSKMGGGE